jgi:putative transposase
MDNHTHLVAIPESKDSFTQAIAEVHRRYTLVINAREDWKGYLWQGRFISYPLDEARAYRAVRYVERNPVRAGLVRRAENYEWSSARAHVKREPHPLLTPSPLEAAITGRPILAKATALTISKTSAGMRPLVDLWATKTFSSGSRR